MLTFYIAQAISEWLYTILSHDMLLLTEHAGINSIASKLVLAWSKLDVSISMPNDLGTCFLSNLSSIALGRSPVPILMLGDNERT